MAIRHFFVSLLALAPIAAAHPAVPRPDVRRGSAQDPGESPRIVIYDKDVVEPTKLREAVVWVDEAGSPVRTATEKVLLLPTRVALCGVKTDEPTTTTTMTRISTQTVVVTRLGAIVPAIPSIDASKTQAKSSVAPFISSSSDVPTATSTGDSATYDGTPAGDGSNSTGSSGLDGRFGITYTPYRADHQCKSQDDINDDFKKMSSYSFVRIYGTDCNQVSMVYSAAKANNMKLFLGIWDLSAVQNEASKIISSIKDDWNMVHTVSVGNELVNSHQATADDVITAVREARSFLRAAGYEGPVVAVDTFIATESFPELCDESDYCAINAHAFFDSTIAANQAGTWLRNTVSRVKSVLSSPKRVVVTETGWPVQGMTNGKAIPSMENQKAALDSIREEFSSTPGDVILFSAFNDLWKTKDAATFDADQYWGINGAVSSCDT